MGQTTTSSVLQVLGRFMRNSVFILTNSNCSQTDDLEIYILPKTHKSNHLSGVCILKNQHRLNELSSHQQQSVLSSPQWWTELFHRLCVKTPRSDNAL